MKMRKDWIRTEEEVELRQLQKLAKEQKKVNKLTNNQQYRPNLPIVMRKRKRLMIKPTTEELIIKPVNIDNPIKSTIFLCLLDQYANIFRF
jgi:hypothetical protein